MVPLSHPLVRSWRRVTPLPLRTRRQTPSLTSSYSASWAARCAYSRGSELTQAVPPHAGPTREPSGAARAYHCEASPSSSVSAAVPRGSSHTALHVLPSPVEVHQVIARAVQHGRWEYAIRLLLGAIHSHCVPLAETYQLVLLAALRGGGWQTSVELTEQVATSVLSTTALYHTAADLLLAQPGQESHSTSEALARAVVEELVPLMLADATRHIAWKPRHRESVVRVLMETNHPQHVSALFQRWASAAPGGGAYACGQRESSLLMSAFAATGDWRSAEVLRVHGPAASDTFLVDYVRAFTVALQRSRAAEGPPQLVPWEVAVDAMARHKESSVVVAAVAQLQHTAHQAAAPADIARWWWSADTTVHAKLTELRRRCVHHSPAEATQLLGQCHVTRADVVELLHAVEDAGVLSAREDVTLYGVQWLSVVLVLAQYCPGALVSPDNIADGFARLLPNPHLRVPRCPASPTGFSLSSGVAEGIRDVALWQYVAFSMLDNATKKVSANGGSAAHCVLTYTTTLHYLLHAQETASSASASLSSSTAVTHISKVTEEVCAVWTARLRTLHHTQAQEAAGQPSQQPRSATVIECKDAIAVHLCSISANVRVPSFEQCVDAVLNEAAGLVALVDTSTFALLKPLEQLGNATTLCEALCAAYRSTYSLSTKAAYVLVLYACQQLREGVAVVALRPILRHVEELLHCVDEADALAVLCAQLQWCWGASMEGLRVHAIPILLRRQCWAAVAQLLARCPPPLSAQEQRAAAMCAQGQRLAQMQTCVDAGDVDGACAVWESMNSGDSAALVFPASLHGAVVTLLVAHNRLKDACDVLSAVSVAVQGGGSAASSQKWWPHIRLRVCRHVFADPEADLPLSDMWAVAQVERSEVVKRETTMGLAMYAAFALSLQQRNGEALRLLGEAEAYVAHYDSNHYHYHYQENASLVQDNEAGGTSRQAVNTLASGLAASNVDGGPSALYKTDAQLSSNIPLYVQCAMPSILVAALSHATTATKRSPSAASADVPDANAVAAVLRVTPLVFSLTSRLLESVCAWAVALPALHSAAAAAAAAPLANEKETQKIANASAAADLALSLARRILRQGVALRVLLPQPLLQLIATAITTDKYSNSDRAAVIDDVQQALCTIAQGDHGVVAESSLARVQNVASQVAHYLAVKDSSRVKALEWVDAFRLWAATIEGRMDSAALWQWIQAGCSVARQHADARNSLQQRYADEEALLQSGGCVRWRKSFAERFSVESLNALIECGAWQDAFSCYLRVILEPNVIPTATGTEQALMADAAMALVELRDAYLSPGVLNRVMQCVARHAPWRTCVQAWMLLCAHVSLLSPSVSSGEAMPGLLTLLSMMRQQEAQPHEVGAVLVWVVAQFDPSPSSLSPLLNDFAKAIVSAPAWTRAEGELCAARLQHLRCLLSEQRVREAARAIAEAEAVLAPPPSSHAWGGIVVLPHAETWLLPSDRPVLSSSEVDALMVLAPLLLLATTSQLESLAQSHLGGRYQGYELKALLWWYRPELLQRVAAAAAHDDGDNDVAVDDAAVVQYLAQNVTLHVYASQVFAQRPNLSDDATAAGRWLADVVFDGLIPPRLAKHVWRACRSAASTLAACRWSAVVEAELCAGVLRRHGKPPTELHTAPHLSRRAIAHYWSCFHRVLEPDLHFGSLELCCLASYVPALTELRARHPDPSQGGYATAVQELAGHVYSVHFSPSRVPAEDTLAYLRRPHSPAAIAAVLTVTYKRLKVLHAQLFASPTATETEMPRSLPPHLHRRFSVCAAAVPIAGGTPADLQQASLASAVRRLSAGQAGETSFASVSATSPHAVDLPRNAITTKIAATDQQSGVDANARKATSPLALLEAVQHGLSSLLLRSWLSWVVVNCVVPRQPIPPAVSLVMVEWLKEDLRHPSPPPPRAEAATNEHSRVKEGASVQAQWRAHAAAGQSEVRQCRCRELSRAWQLLSEIDAWPLMHVGHRVAVERMVSPSAAQVAALPSKTRGGGSDGIGVSPSRKVAKKGQR